nr:hypothetical protein CFP56_03571 [Quercus suber]
MSLLSGPGPELISGLFKKEKKINIIPSHVNFGLSGYFIPISVERKANPLQKKLCFLHHAEPPPPHSLIAGAERRKKTKFTLKTPLQTDSKQNEERNPALRKKLLTPHLCFLHAEPPPPPHRSPEQNDFEEDRVLAVSSGLCRPLLAQTSTTPHTGAHRHRVRRSCAWSLETNRSRREPRSKESTLLVCKKDIAPLPQKAIPTAPVPKSQGLVVSTCLGGALVGVLLSGWIADGVG